MPPEHDDELYDFLAKWCELVLDKTTPTQDRPDSRQSFALIKYLLDGKEPIWKPEWENQLREVYFLLQHMPDTVREDCEELVSAWKAELCTDPEKYIMDEQQSGPIAAIV